ncbi:MAG: MFS transporter, partial [Pseudonocardiaceae bacterium]|nr:MFS transporter [Pseudonocardiaceae bacterium]
YGAAAALVLGPQYFPNFSPVAGVLAAFGTFAAGFVARPIGGLLFGHFGDRLGRKRTLIASLLLMGVGTLLVAVLPTYEQIGVAAPLVLVLLRIVQGLGVGGEWGGAVLMAIEHAPRGRRAFYSSFPQMGIPSGIILSNVVFLAVGAVTTSDQFGAWGWRIPFLFSALLVVTALIIRLKLEESPEFADTRERGAVRRLPAVDVLRTSSRSVVLGMGVSFAPSAIGYLFSVYLLSYGTREVGLPQQTLLLLITLASVCYLAFAYVSGRIADRVGPRRVFLGSMALSLVAPFGCFLLFETATVSGALTSLVILGVLLGFMVGVQAIIVSGAFETSLRYTGASLSYQLGAVLGGGLTPLLATAIFAATGSTQFVAGYIAALVIVSAICVYLLPTSPRGDELAEPSPGAVATGAS